MKNLLILTALTMLFFSSCKEDELTLTHKRSGALTVQLKDATGAPIADAKVYLSTNSGIEGAIDQQMTDANGHINFGAVLEDNYIIIGKDIKDGEYAYTFRQAALVTSASTNNVEIVPSEYSSTINISIREKDTDHLYKPLGSDVKVALVKYDESRLKAFSRNAEFDELKEGIIKELSGDGANHDYTFENVPINDYLVMVYTEADYYDIISGVETYDLEETVNLGEISVLSTDIRKYEADQLFKVTKQDGFSIVPFKDCKILIVEEDDNNKIGNTSDFDAVSAMSIASSTTDANGETTFKVRKYRDFYVYYFSVDNTFLESYLRSNNDSSIDYNYPGIQK